MKSKKYILIIILILSVSKINAQQLQNPSFDSVYIGGIDRLWNWITSDAAFMGGNTSGDTMGPQQINTLFNFQGHELFGYIDVYNPSPYSPVAVKLNTSPYKKNNGDPFETYIVNGEHYYTGSDGYIDFKRCGVPFTYRPDSLRGYYKYIDSINSSLDYGWCSIFLKKYNAGLGTTDTIAYVEDSLSFNQTAWSNFSIPINYVSSMQPDSLIVIFKASTRPFEGSSFWLDNLEFVYGPNATTDIKADKNLPVVYPNPNIGTININAQDYKLVKYEICDINGRFIQKGNYKKQLEMPQHSHGILFLKVYDKNGLVKSYKINSIQ